MATDADVMQLLGRQIPPSMPQPCGYCLTGIYVVVGAWHPEGQAGAYLVLGCPRCGATVNGGAP